MCHFSRFCPTNAAMIAALVLFAPCSPSLGAALPRVELTGEISIRDTRQPEAMTLTTSFEVLLDGAKWRILLGSHDEIAYDGTQVYGFNTFRSPNDGRAINDSNASVYEMALPPPEYMDIFGLWFAYASVNVLDSGNSRIKNIFVPGNPKWMFEGTTLPIQVSKLESSPYWPIQVAIYSDGMIYPNRRGAEPRPYTPPYDKGFLQREYKVLQYTNVNTWVFPKEFVWKVFHPADGSSTNDLIVIQETLGILKSVHFIDNPPDVVPKVTGATYTVDGRFGDLPEPAFHVVYLNTNEIWVDKNNPVLRALYREEAQRQRDEMGRTARRAFSYWIWIVSAVLLLVPAFFLIRNRLLARE